MSYDLDKSLEFPFGEQEKWGLLETEDPHCPKAYATPVADVNSMGWVKGGVATPLNASNYDAWVASDNKIQLKGMYYKPFLEDLVIGEIEDADANFKQFVKEIDSSPEVYLVGRTQVVPNTPNNAVNIGNSNLLTSDKSDEYLIKNNN